MNVMIVDDQKLTGKLLEKYLSNVAEIDNIYTVTTGKELFKELTKKNIDLVLTDINMPVMDGMLIIEKLNKKYPTVKIVVLSVHDESWIMEKAFDIGISGYISKHSSREEIVHAVINADQSKPLKIIQTPNHVRPS